jgi:hypothetical protein|tara:strand:+ start:535 stop:1020 length:486 start_codon:yes stop_codon:yes gene_type:complete
MDDFVETVSSPREEANPQTTNTELNLGQIKSMLDEIEAMNEDDHQNIIKILQENDIKYMENDNGIFVKMNQLPINIIRNIYDYVAEVRETKNVLETAIQSMEPVELMNERNKIQSSSVEKSEQDITIDVEDWKMAIIEKMRDQTKNKKQKRKPVSKSSIST